MKRLIIISLITGMIFLFSNTVFGMYTPEVIERHGVVVIRNSKENGLVAGGQFGLTEDLAVVADVGEDDFNRAAIKFQLNPTLSVLGGVKDSELFLGFNFGGEFTENISGLGELDIYKLNDRYAYDYEVGLKFSITPNLDIRGGLFGTVTETDTTRYIQYGIGYKF